MAFARVSAVVACVLAIVGCGAFGADDAPPTDPPSPGEDAGSDASLVDGGADGPEAAAPDAGRPCTPLPFEDDFERDDVAGTWQMIGNGATLSIGTGEDGRRNLRADVQAELGPAGATFGQYLERRIDDAACGTPETVDVAFDLIVSSISAGGVRIEELSFAETRIFARIEPGPKLAIYEQLHDPDQGFPTHQLAWAPLVLNQTYTIAIGYDGRTPPKLAVSIDQVGRNVAPLQLDHQGAQKLLAGAAWLDPGATSTFFLDRVSVR
jgi:hypothetical protein